ncbi:MAG: RNA-binding protein [Sphingobacteriales bacterium]|nr:MAG: RNA-binding protein [Sphingobacteriales bacterium]TAF82708.1 MAG: RNA-binding protein [Sphingobacteriales bacterium]
MKFIFYTLCLSLFFVSCKKKEQPLYREIPASESGIYFNNQIVEDADFNIIRNEYLYNGAGVGIGDFNNDGLPDIYFAGNRVPPSLYLNKGGFKFEDVTAKAGVLRKYVWSNGVSVVDINNDGLMDIYISCLRHASSGPKKNLLYVNQKTNDKNQPIFKEMAEEYGLADTSSTTMASFFDYDNDGDLDVYLLVNLYNDDVNTISPVVNDGTRPSTDKLYQNNWDAKLKHPVFTDVSKKAGITAEGYGLGINIVDINNDGYKDIYVSNDYMSNNLLYINNRNGTFTNKAPSTFKHISRNAMGNDIADINNDGLVDIVELDMSPQDNYRIKMMYTINSYNVVRKMDEMGYTQQNIHNCLQLNQGNRMLANDSIGAPIFSDIAYFSGIAQTDWSWAPLLVDVDNDGLRDLMITNGLPKDVTDLDFIAYRELSNAKTPLKEILSRIPSLKIPNYMYKNNGNATFTDKTLEWGWQTPTFSSGMAYADFDNDGDIDVVVNNTNMEASLLENTTNENKTDSQPTYQAGSNYIRIKLNGSPSNLNGIGTKLHLYYNGQQQVYECNPYRGYLSSVENIAHFGLGKTTLIDSILVQWPGFKTQKLFNVATNKTITINIQQAQQVQPATSPILATNNWFTDITKNIGFNFTATETEFVDFNVQRLLPRKLSQQGPSLVSADVNGDGLPDVLVGGGFPNNLKLFIQNTTGKFTSKAILPEIKTRTSDDMGICLFDADNDNDMDIYVASGSNEKFPDAKDYADKFYINDGKANFTELATAIPANTTSRSCVKAADYDADGDLDLFIGGRVRPGVYPMPVNSTILRNDSSNGKVVFTDVTNEVATTLQNFGLVCDATWTDANNDGLLDLIVVGEWMPITIFKNIGGKFSAIETDFATQNGWFNSISSADIDNDGDMDYVVGNFGENSFYKASAQQPVNAYAKDFDNNGSFDVVFSTWLPSAPHASFLEYPTAGRDEIIRELSYIKTKFPNYALYAKATMPDVFSPDELKSALKLSVQNFSTVWVENKGNMQFQIHRLPMQAQLSNINGMVVNDFDGDGNIDIALNSNDYGMAPMLGRNDAMNGLLLKGDGKGNFKPLSILQSGLFIPSNGKALISTLINNKPVLMATQNGGKLKTFSNKLNKGKIITLNNNDQYAIITLKNGKKRKEEFNYGTSYLSQSARFIQLNHHIKSIQIVNNKQQTRTVLN